MSNLYGWRFEWISNATEPGMTKSEHTLRMNQLAKNEADRLYCEHGVRVPWTRIRDGGPLVERDLEIDATWAGW